MSATPANYETLSKDELVRLLTERDNDTESNPHKKKYGLIWEDKPEQFEADSVGRIPVLKRDPSKCIQSDTAKPTHVLIQGDNYHALKVLTYTHERSVDVIYIDPPYNTGNKDFKYNDEFVDREDGYRHSKWLSFMAKRLRLAKALLKDTGTLFISIDSNEQAPLRLLCDEILGETCFVGMILYKKQGGGKADSKFLAVNHEYVLVYVKDPTKAVFGQRLGSTDHFNKVDDATGKRYRLQPLAFASLTYSKSLDYEVTTDEGEKLCAGGNWEAYEARRAGNHAEKDWQWRVSAQEFARRRAEGRVRFVRGRGGLVTAQEVCFQPPEGENLVPFEDYFDEVTNRTATSELKDLFEGRKVFSHPKPVALLKHLLAMPVGRDPVVLDFFAGSGTTAHAVMQLNDEDGGARRCILVTNDEGEFKDDAGAVLPGGICAHVTYPRLKKVMEGYTTPKGKEVAGLGENLVFFETEFVEDRALERHRRELSARSAEMLCLRESCFTEEPVGDKRWRSFTDGKGKRLVVVSDPYAAEDLRPLLMADKRQIVLYAFRFGDDDSPAREYGGKGLEHVTAKPVPDSLLALHRRLAKQA